MYRSATPSGHRRYLLTFHLCSLSLTQHINELTMKLDIQEVLQGAEAIYLQLSGCQVGPGFPSLFWAHCRVDHALCSPLQDLPLRVQQVLGLCSPSSSEESPDSQTGEADRFQAG